ncbi:MAG: hypothetical protein K2H63_03820, partial [Paramuribaculum sp.]|nr:hypothetical protein [Paramuribaculum sp.]
MKKLLLLLMAILLFAPPRANAETKEFVLYDQSLTTLTYNFIKNGHQTNLTWSTLSPTTATTGNSSNGYIYKLRNLDAASKFDVSLTVENKGTAASLTHIGNTTATDRYLKLANNYYMTFSVGYGKITSVDVTIWSGSSNGSNSALFALAQNTNGTTASYKSNTRTWTLKNTDPNGIFTFGYQGQADISKIVVHCDVPEAVPTPEVDFHANADYGYIYDEQNGTLKIPHFYSDATKAAWMGTSSAYEQVYYTTSATAENFTASTSVLNLTNGVTTNWSTTSNESIKWVHVVPGLGLRFRTMPGNDKLDTAAPITLRMVTYNTATGLISPEKKVTISFYRFKSPDVDFETMKTENKTAKILRFDENSNTIYYSGYNPKVYLKDNTSLAAYKIKYSSDFQTIPTITTGTDYDNSKGIEFVNGAKDILPVDGTRNQVWYMAWKAQGVPQMTGNTYAYTLPASDYLTLNLVCEGNGSGEGGGNTAIPIAAPIVSTSDKCVSLSGGVRGYIKDQISVTIRSQHNWEEGETAGALQYQWADASNGVWAQTPDETLWKTATDGKYNVTGTGRLFVREYKEDYDPRTAYYDFNKIAVEKVRSLKYSDLLGVDDAATAITMTEPVRLIGSFPLSDENSNTQQGKNVYIMFFADKDGNVLRVHNEDAGENPWPYDEANRYKMFRNLTGELRKNKGMPELYLNNSSLDYSVFLDGPKEVSDPEFNLGDDYPTYIPTQSDKVPEISNYSKLMYFGPLRWNKKDETFDDNYGGSVKLYQRINTEITVDKLVERLNETGNGVQYRIAGYVGYADGAPVILPRAIVAAPRLLAPNPINENAAPNELIDMDVISDNLTITVDTEGLA